MNYLLEKGARSAPGNYRSVSLACVICNVMESLMKYFIVEHLTKNSLIRSNLLEYMEELSSLVDDDGLPVDMFYLDSSKLATW